MFYDFIYLAKGFRMRPKVWSPLIGKFNSTEMRMHSQSVEHWESLTVTALRDVSAYISGSHKGTRSQCKKVYIFPNFDEKIPNMRGKFPKSDKVSLWILLYSQKHVFCEFFLL